MADGRLVLVINGGSSSLKFALFDCPRGEEPARRFDGSITGIGTTSAAMTIGGGAEGQRPRRTLGTVNHAAAARHLIEELGPRLAGAAPAAIAHRVVHGGERFVETTGLTPAVMAALRTLTPLAPNHLPSELALIDAFLDAFPRVPQMACFDTAFHHALPEVSRVLPVPPASGVRRYGFHGLSYAFLLHALERDAGRDAAGGRLVLAHLGSGASVAAVSGRRPIDTSMGMTPAGGLVMSTRSGDLDPGVVSWLARTRALSADGVERLLTEQAGLRAVSGGTGDMEALLAREAVDDRAALAVSMFCYQLRKWIAAMAAAMGGVETVVFTGGIGEHAPSIRQRACGPLAFLGLAIDQAANERNGGLISAAASRVAVRVIPTDEAWMMALEVRRRLDGR